MDRGINPLLIKCLLYMYTNQHLNVSWNNSSLFLHYDWIEFGCMICHKCYGAIGYADDNIFNSSINICIEKMCDICLEFASEYDLFVCF